MKITLINPPFEDKVSAGTSGSIKYVLNVIAPLGLAYLAAVLEKNNFRVNIIDCSIGISYDAALAKIISDKPRIVGISASTAVFESAKIIARKIKESVPQAIIVIGGAHVTAIPEQAMQECCFDIAVLGEGEATFLELARHIQEKGFTNLEVVKGIIFKEGAKCIATSKRDFIKDLDSIPYPARHLLSPLSSYRPTPASYKKLPLGVIMTSRGCPNQCTFCDRAVFGNTFRQRSSHNVLGEIDEVVDKYGAREIRFFDDCFALDKKRTYEICQGLKKRKKRVGWTCLTTVASVDRDLLGEMRSAGCWQILYGLESADERMLKSLKKGDSLKENINAVRLAKEVGLSVRADFIVGTPGETEESLDKTLKFAIGMRLDYAHFNKFVPYPGTELYRRLVREGNNFDFTKASSITAHRDFLYIPPTLNRQYYARFVNYAHRKFYLRPSYILRRLFSLKTWDELRGQMSGFLSIALLR